jgi:putative SOS response-associated peptidase YedK
MCARYTYNKNEAKLRLREQMELYGLVPKVDIRPTDLGPVVLPEFEGFACCQLSWGWQVPWQKQPLINAKAETLTALPTFRPHLAQRCLLLADGFYEGGAQFAQPGGGAFCFAGLWREENGGRRYTLLTTSPNASVAKFHSRMPFILRPADYDAWLGSDWERVLTEPDHAPLELFQRQPELF